MSRLVSIGEASQIKGVSVETLRKWEAEGKINAVRTSGGHRRYDITELMPLSYDARKTVAYCRVSSHDQKAEQREQALVLAAYCESHGWSCELIQDLGSGLNYKKKGLRKLIEYILDEKVDRLVLTHKDRLLRFGSELIFALCEHFGIEAIILNRKEDSSFEEDLAKDVLEINERVFCQVVRVKCDKQATRQLCFNP